MTPADMTRIAREMSPRLSGVIDVSPAGCEARTKRIQAATTASRIREGLHRDSRAMLRRAEIQTQDELYDSLHAVLAATTDKDSLYADKLQALLLEMDDERHEGEISRGAR